jgi:hypothetical protein
VVGVVVKRLLLKIPPATVITAVEQRSARRIGGQSRPGVPGRDDGISKYSRSERPAVAGPSPCWR